MFGGVDQCFMSTLSFYAIKYEQKCDYIQNTFVLKLKELIIYILPEKNIHNGVVEYRIIYKKNGNLFTTIFQILNIFLLSKGVNVYSLYMLLSCIE